MKRLITRLKGFTLAELLISVSIITTLVVASMFTYNRVAARARDARRIANVEQIKTALEFYKRDPLNLGILPNETDPQGAYGNWEISCDTAHPFMEYLSPYMNGSVPIDPANRCPTATNPNNTYIAYHYYDAASGAWSSDPGAYFGCGFHGDFAVVAVRTLEVENSPNLPQAFCDNRATPSQDTCHGSANGGGIAHQCRYWSNSGFDYSFIVH